MKKEILFEGMDDLLDGNCISDEQYKRDKALFKRMGDLGFWHTNGCFVTTYIKQIQDYIRIYQSSDKKGYNLYVPDEFLNEDYEEGCYCCLGDVFTTKEQLSQLFFDLVYGRNKEIRKIKQGRHSDAYECLKRDAARIKYEMARIERAKCIQEIQTTLHEES